MSENRELLPVRSVMIVHMELDRTTCYRAVKTRDARFDGRFFIAVRTTGIYCRPICPARTPKPENVTFYATAAAAQEAGYRPCLRCRPECSPDSGVWRGTSNSVSRALSLIEAGALDNGDVDTLAERLGLGERQLRRLFREHIGASPITVALTRRVHLAKQLIHETQLSMTEVALASGFGSVRRFNEVFRRMYGRPPRSLRRETVDASRGVQSAVRLRLSYRPPYDWASIIGFLGPRAITGVESAGAHGYARSFNLDGSPGSIEVVPSRLGAWLDATIRVSRVTSLPVIISRLRRLFDLSADPAEIGAQLAEDCVLSPLVRQRPGLRVPGAFDPFELAVRAVLGQQVSVAAASSLASRLVEKFGEPFTPDVAVPGLSRLFPEPKVLAAADISVLGMPGSRAKAVSAVAAAVLRDPNLLQPGQGLDAAIARLMAVPGVGEWTAQYIALRALGETDAFPASDIGLQRALVNGSGQRPSARELGARAETWKPWRAYAAIHLWTQDGAIAPTQRTKPHARGARQSQNADRGIGARL
jgi:AraC family transcriptional regulator, regulatory protein of adaptative response / DNA-3-methyladenine glycosylase II